MALSAADFGPIYAWRQGHDGAITMRPVIKRRAILRLEGFLREGAEALGEDPECAELCPVTHHFAPGLYAREIFLPAGVVIVGKIHRHAHVNTISQGHVLAGSEFGPMDLRAPHSFVSRPGTKRVIYAIADTVWTTYHPTELTDIDAIERSVIAPTFDALCMDHDAARNLIEGVQLCHG